MALSDIIKYFVEVKDEREQSILLPEKRNFGINSGAYNLYKEEEKIQSIPKTLYEKACNISKSILTIEPDEKTRKSLQGAIDITGLKTTPEGTTSFVVLSGLLFGFFIILGMIMKLFYGFGLSVGNAFVLILTLLIFSIYMYYYPIHLEKIYRVKLKSQIVRMFVYMSIYLRNYPNIEGSIVFAADNSPEPLAYTLRKMIWDVEVGRFKTMKDAINNFLKYWKDDKKIVETMQILLSSIELPTKKRLEVIDNAISNIMEGARDEAKDFNLKMRMPITSIYALGILLPIMGMVLVPIMIIFLSNYFKPSAMFITYNIILPITLLFVVTNVIDRRPIAFAPADISKNPNVPPNGKFKMKLGHKIFYINALVPSSLALPIVYMGYKSMRAAEISGKSDLWPSVLIVFGTALFFYIYYKFLAFQRIKIREDTRRIENELPESLYKISNFIERGKPIEISLEESLHDIGKLKINKMFSTIVENIKMRGMTFEQAINDSKFGAILFFPSDLISSTLKIIVEASKKGVRALASTMKKISVYLKYTKEVQDQVVEMLSEVTSSVKFQAIVLTPVLTAVITSMSTLVIKVLNKLADLMSNSNMGGSVPMFGKVNITPGQFQFSVGLYMIESAMLLVWFYNAIENADDNVSRYDATASTILISTIIYIIVLFISWLVFGRTQFNL